MIGIIKDGLLIMLAGIALIAIIIEAISVAVKWWGEWRGAKNDE